MSTASQPIILNAQVAPAASIGNVTFYDGSTILGVVPISSGNARFSTAALLSGAHLLSAGYSNSISNVVHYAVAPVPGYNIVPAVGSPFTAGSVPLSVVTADFNEDGFADLAVANYSSHDVSILYGDGSGAFAAPVSIALGPSINPVSLVVGDFGNGHADLAVASGNNAVSIAMGNGKAGFTLPPTLIPLPGSTGIPYSIVVADFNRDGWADLAVSRSTTNDVVVLRGDGTGGFQPAPGSPFGIGQGAAFATAGDFNGDGFPDLAVISIGNSQVNILLNNVLLGGGSAPWFKLGTPFTTIASDRRWSNLVAADLDNDGNLDLAIAGYPIEIWFGTGTGAFNVRTPRQASTSALGVPYALAAADFNGDGFLDLGVAVAGYSQSAMLLGDGKGGFTEVPWSPFSYTEDAYSTTVGDFNGDGRPDLVLASRDPVPPSASGNVAVLLGGVGLTVVTSRPATFVAGQSGTLQVLVQNQTAGAIAGEVDILQTLPAAYVPTVASGTGWTCPPISGQVVKCSRLDGLAGNSSFPPINVTVNVTGAACQGLTPSIEATPILNVNTLTQVSLNGIKAAIYQESVTTSVLNCMTISLGPSGPLVATQPAALTATLTAANGASIPSEFPIQVVMLAGGLTSVSASANPGWSCSNSGGFVTCSILNSAIGSGGQYLPIKIAGTVDPGACPTMLSEVTVLGGSTVQNSSTFPVDLYGCLRITPTPLAINFGTIPYRPVGVLQFGSELGVTSTDKHPLKSVSSSGIPSLLAVTGNGNCTGVQLANLGDSCLIVPYVFSCATAPNGVLTVTADANVGILASYQIPVYGSTQLDNFSINVNSGNAQLQAGQSYPVGMTLSPVPTSSCPQNVAPTLSLSFSPPSSEAAYPFYDASLDPTGTNLAAGTVAGAITLTAQTTGQPFSPLSGSNTINLTVPNSVAVIQSVSIGSRAASSFQVTVDAFSPPRETSASAKTQVCLTFLAAAGAVIDPGTTFCALQQEIMLWYNEAGSAQYGSRFQGQITVSFNGDQSAIGAIKVVVQNMIGDSAPYCVSFKSGKQPCP